VNNPIRVKIGQHFAVGGVWASIWRHYR